MVKSIIVSFSLALTSVFILGIIGLVVKADYTYIAMGGMFIGVSTAYASNPTTGRLLKHTALYLISITAILAITSAGIYYGILDSNTTVLGVIATETLVIALLSRYIALLSAVRGLKKFINKYIKILEQLATTSRECSTHIKYLKELLFSLRESMYLYLREEHEYAVILSTGALEKFLHNIRTAGLINEKGFSKAIKEFIKKYGTRNEINEILCRESAHLYSLRSKYAHGNIPPPEQAIQISEPFEISEFIKQTEQLFKHRFAVFEAIAAIAYSSVFAYRATEILAHKCPNLAHALQAQHYAQ